MQEFLICSAFPGHCGAHSGHGSLAEENGASIGEASKIMSITIFLLMSLLCDWEATTIYNDTPPVP